MWLSPLIYRLLIFLSLLALASCIPAPQDDEKGLAFINNRKRLWPFGIVVFKMGKLFTPDQRKALRKSMDYIISLMAPGCVRFVEMGRANVLIETTKYVSIVLTDAIGGQECSADIGTSKYGDESEMKLGPKCFEDEGTLTHELLHVLGAAHEHVRPDRNLFLEVDCDNILENELIENQFTRKVRYSETSYTPFDPNSIMQYSVQQLQYAAKNKGKPIMSIREPFNKKYNLNNNRVALTPSDIVEISKNYNCSVKPDIQQEYDLFLEDITTQLVDYMADCVKQPDKETEKCLEGIFVAEDYLTEWSQSVQIMKENTGNYDTVNQKWKALKNDYSDSVENIKQNKFIQSISNPDDNIKSKKCP